MPLSHAFRLSFYVSLALSCLTLFYGEWDFVPWVCAFFPVMLVLMGYAYAREGRDYLNETIANRIGTGIGILTITWIIFKVPRTEAELAAGGVPWPAALVPLLAPLLPLLLLVKLFRPKSLADFWVFQTISLVIVTLACILAGEIVFFMLLVIFLVSLLWCMALFFLYRQKVRDDHPDLDPRRFPLFGPKEAADPMATPLFLLGIGRALRWATPVVLLGLTLFFFLPRFSDSQWVPNKLQAANQLMMKAGGGPGIDMLREGVIEMRPDPAFEVQVFNNDGKPIDLPANQHWRLEVLDVYNHGKFEAWEKSTPFRSMREPLPSREHLAANTQLPSVPPTDMKDAQVYLYFQIDHHLAGGVPLADPISSKTEVGLFPHFDDDNRSQNPFIRLQVESGIFLGKTHGASRTMRYGQIITPSWRGLQVPAFPISTRYLSHLVSPVAPGQEIPPSIEKFARKLLGQLPGLTREDIQADENKLFPKEKHAKIAQALCNHLAHSGMYSYSLRQRFLDRSEDPAADFLINVREGHCVRFAGGLTLMLRSLRIPARLVSGYQGYESLAKGRHLIKQNMAHAWVEALVPGDKDGVWVWLQLDPTPSNGDEAETSLTLVNWMWSRLSNPQFLWKNMIMDYNTERQSEAKDQLQHIWQRLTAQDGEGTVLENLWETYHWLIVILGALATAWLAFLLRRLTWRRGRTRAAAAPPDFYTQLLRVLARRCRLQPATGQTPLEFARLAGKTMADSRRDRTGPLSAELTDVPIRAVKLLYRLRFGGQPSVAEECLTLEGQIAELDAALR